MKPLYSAVVFARASTTALFLSSSAGKPTGPCPRRLPKPAPSTRVQSKTRRQLWAGRGLALLCDIQPAVPCYVIGDSVRIQQIILNLLGNAIKFTEYGQVGLEVALESQDRDELRLHFVIRDTGIGIGPQKRKLVLEAFSQADSSTAPRFGGTGLGLTISSRLVDAMRGKTWVESELGKGSRFHFTVCLGAASKVSRPARGCESGGPSRIGGR